MTAAELINLGSSAFGEGWKAPLAEACGIRRETVWRYASGRSVIPADRAVRIRDVCRKRINGEISRLTRAAQRANA